MSANDSDKSPRSYTAVLWVLFLGLALALAGNIYQFSRSARLSSDMAANERSTQLEIRKLADSAGAALQLDQQRFDQLKDELSTSAAATLRQARSEVKRSSSQLTQSLSQAHQDVVDQLSDLKQETSAKLDDTSSKLNDTSAKLNQVSGDLDKTGSDVRQVTGDLGVVSGQVGYQRQRAGGFARARRTQLLRVRSQRIQSTPKGRRHSAGPEEVGSQAQSLHAPSAGQ